MLKNIGKKNFLEKSLKATHKFWAANGSTCPSEEECVKNGMETYADLENFANFERINDAYNNCDDSAEMLKVQTVLMQSETRHAATVKNTPSKTDIRYR